MFRKQHLYRLRNEFPIEKLTYQLYSSRSRAAFELWESLTLLPPSISIFLETSYAESLEQKMLPNRRERKLFATAERATNLTSRLKSDSRRLSYGFLALGGQIRVCILSVLCFGDDEVPRPQRCRLDHFDVFRVQTIRQRIRRWETPPPQSMTFHTICRVRVST